MAPIHGHLMVPQTMRIVKFAIAQSKSLIRTKAPTATQTKTSLNPIRTYTQKKIAVHPTALLKQSKSSQSQPYGSRPYSSSLNSASKSSGPKYDRSSFPTSRTSRAITRTGAAPFSSTLRPNLTGGTLPRSAGGYSLGSVGRAKQFSHTSGCQAQVIQNASAGIRAFFVSGSKARFDGIDPVTGEKRWRAMTKTQNQVYEKWAAAPRNPRGTSLEFQLSPTITALLPTSPKFRSSVPNAGADEITLNSTGVLSTLSSDFTRALRDLALITHDLTKLSAFGDLPLSLTHIPSGPLLRVRFPGCDADAVSALCDEVDIRRGVIVEDSSWAKSRDADMALLFPFAPSETSEELDVRDYFVKRLPEREQESVQWRDMPRSPSCGASSAEDEEGEMSSLHYDLAPTPSSLEGYESLSEIYYHGSSPPLPSAAHSPAARPQRATDTASGKSGAEAEYGGVEGIYRFLQEIDDARRR